MESCTSEKEKERATMSTGRQFCALTNMKNYFVSREWAPETRKDRDIWRACERGMGEYK
jgi:hypothetical protein